MVTKLAAAVGLASVVALLILFNFGLRRHHNPKADLIKRFDINEVQELTSSHVTIAHREAAEEKLKRLRSHGPSHLQLIIDFDKTLTKYKDKNGVSIKSTHDVFASVATVPKSYVDGAGSLYAMYGPIESDPSIPIQEKLPYMEQWVADYQNLVRDIPLNRSLVQDAVRRTNLVLRDRSKELFERLNQASVPVLIYSAGIGDVITAALQVYDMDLENVHVISNFFDISQDKIRGFKGHHIHAFNKNQRILEQIDFKYAEQLTGRSSVILVGDSLGDATMADGLPHSTNILRIGFLNNKVDESMPFYQEAFDIVVVQDESMNVVNAVLNKIL